MYILAHNWVKYNANSRGKHVGDCVKRALSVAYGEDYDDISKELNRVNKSIGGYGYNVSSTFKVYMQNRGARIWTRVPKDKRITEWEFCDEHPTGTYVCLTGKVNSKESTHMVCIMNGNIYDSWDSSDYVIFEYVKITNGASSYDVQSVSIYECEDELEEAITSYLDSVRDKYNWIVFSSPQFIKGRDGLTLESKIKAYMYDVPDTSKYYYGSRLSAIGLKSYSGYATTALVLKLNPAKSVDENIKILKAKIKQKLYDWIYNFRKDVENARDAEKIERKTSRFYGNKPDLMKLPEWSRPYVYEINFNTYRNWGYPYEVYMDPLPGDPNEDTVRFYGDTLSELKYHMNDYYENDFDRYNW